jgi:hypothetical protein
MHPGATSAGSVGEPLGDALGGVRWLTPAELEGVIVPLCLVAAVLVFALLRAEESRLARELRTARTATGVLRGMVSRRRQQAPFFARLFATRLGAAAIRLADGDRDEALDALARGSRLVRGGRLEKLRAVVEADLDRATGTPPGIERCVERLRAMAPIGNREADLYRIHVLTKALLEGGDGESALELVDELERHGEEEDEQVYTAWLRVWFDLDAESADYRHAWRPLGDGQVRLAMLLARAHGAAKLVEKLDSRLPSGM